MYRQRTFQTVQEARHLACRSAGHLLYGPQVKDVSGPGQVRAWPSFAWTVS